MYNKLSKKAVRNIENAVFEEFNKHIPEIVSQASTIYEDLLLGITIDRDSLANPEYYYDTYVYRIEHFNYLKESNTKVQLEIPNEDTFDFSGELVILKMITEGVVGNYLELPEKDLNIILKAKGLDDKVKRRFRSLPGVTNSDLPLNRRFSLLNTKSDLANVAQEILDKKLVFFPFSNAPPLNVFEGLEEYVKSRITDWISSGIKEGLHKLEVQGI